MKEILDISVQQDRFRMNKVFRSVMAKQSEQTILFQSHSELDKLFGKARTKKLLQGILRFAFFIEPVKKPKIETTKYIIPENRSEKRF